ncbi:unnamed protein product [Didymodactylos carnosus]|uniref:Uncharacterized protein n=1 Tax=Didymodactylos carnosus TaxID=1234261 RepID=A0A815F9G3_9BILA|nr:unnamed protein product [Didymodactylos carnosus]CAF4175835.1 unnamed protein product [Didymodactylos carnosus]
MQTIKDACNAVSDKAKEMVSGASYESNKETAKDSSQTAGTRIGAGIDAAKDKVEETGHAASKEVNKQKATH